VAELEEEPRILVVDDEALVRSVYMKTLERAGFRALPVGTVAAARELIDDATQQFDAAVLDFDLGDGTAFDLVGKLLERKPLCKSLVITGVAGPHEAQRLVQLGAHGFIAKPLGPEALVAGVINTVYATLQWRHGTNQITRAKTPTTIDLTVTEAPGPLGLDPAVVLARLRRIGGLSPLQTMAAYRLMWGDTDREIAGFLDCAQRTAKRHVAAVLRRTGAKSRAGLLGVLLRDSGFDDDPSPTGAAPDA
jgi:DNA-binding NarL/FixJ family response regulator